jgi:hypothetical protein
MVKLTGLSDMVASWFSSSGSLAEWVAGVGTIGTLAFSLYLLNRQVRAEREEQARLVSFWESGQSKVVLQNQSDSPVYEVVLDSEKRPTDSLGPQPPPREANSSVDVDEPASSIHLSSGLPLRFLVLPPKHFTEESTNPLAVAMGFEQPEAERQAEVRRPFSLDEYIERRRAAGPSRFGAITEPLPTLIPYYIEFTDVREQHWRRDSRGKLRRLKARH